MIKFCPVPIWSSTYICPVPIWKLLTDFSNSLLYGIYFKNQVVYGPFGSTIRVQVAYFGLLYFRRHHVMFGICILIRMFLRTHLFHHAILPIHKIYSPCICTRGLMQHRGISIASSNYCISTNVLQAVGSFLNIIGSDNGLSPGRRQAIIWSIVDI